MTGTRAPALRPLLGIDLVHIPTVRALVAGRGRTAFLDEAWLPAEQADCGESAAALAATWAAKEATLKALGVGISQIRLLDIEVVRQDGKPPRIQLHGGALARARELGAPVLTLSLSHEADMAVAAVVGYTAATDAS